MPWLVVLGTGSWSAPSVSKQTYKASYCKKNGTGYEVEQSVADAAQATGYWWLQVFPDRPEVVQEDPTGPLSLDDVRSGVEGGSRLVVLEGGAEPEPDIEDPEAPSMSHACGWCPRRFPSSGALGRHTEFEHTLRHEADVAASIAQYEKRQAERQELRRLEDHEEALPPWEREAIEAGLPPEVES